MGKKIFRINFLGIIFTVGILGFLWYSSAPEVSAAGLVSEVKIFNAASFALEKGFFVSFSKMDEAPSMAMIDLGGDGTNEIVIGAPRGKKPEVKIYREDGSLVNSFLAYDESFLGGVSVGAGDFDGDGKGEIITAPAENAAAEIKIFDGYGQAEISEGFFAFGEELEFGANLAAGDVNNDGKDEIIVGSGPGQDFEIKVFNSLGVALFKINPIGINKWSGVRVASGDVLAEDGEEIIAAPGWGNVPEVQIFGTDGKFIRKFLGYSQSFRGGVNVAAGDLDNDGQSEIVLGAGFTGGPHVRIFDGEGKLKDQFFSFDKGSRNGTLVGVGKFVDGKNKIVAMPNKTAPSGRTDLYKYIDIDISEQRMKIFENGFNLGEYLVSTGTTKMPTPIGTFKVMSKSEVAYSNAYSLYMPHFMLFTKGGAGIHGLPYWKSGSKFIYEGVNHLGKRVSHGCVRLALSNAEIVFEWAEKGTPVIVHQ